MSEMEGIVEILKLHQGVLSELAKNCHLKMVGKDVGGEIEFRETRPLLIETLEQSNQRIQDLLTANTRG